MTRLFEFQRRVPGRSWVWTFFWWTCVRSLVYVFFRLVYRVRLEAKQHVPRTGPAIYVSNHQTHFDPPLVGLLVTDRPFAPLARDSLFRNPAFALLIRSLKSIPVKRDSADMRAMKALIEELSAGRCVLVFPEGARTMDGRTRQFKPGIRLLMKRTGSPVVPIAIEGAHDIWPRERSKPRWRGRIAVRAAEPIAADDLLARDEKEAMEHVRRTIEEMRLELRREMRQRSGNRWPPSHEADVPYWGE